MPIHRSPYPPVPPIPPSTNIFHALWGRPEQQEWKDHIIYLDSHSGKKRTFDAHLNRICDAATGLGSPVSEGGLGLGYDHEKPFGEGKHDVVGIISENSLDYPVLVHALFAIATPVALLSSFSTPFELNHALRLSACTRIFVSEKLLDAVLPVAKSVGLGGDKVHVIEARYGGSASAFEGRLTFGGLVERVRRTKMKRVEVKEVKKDWMAYLMFSSGTSGLPKAVMVSHGNLWACLFQAMILAQSASTVQPPPVITGPDDTPKVLAYLPMYHTYGLHAFIIRPSLARVTIIVMSKWNIEHALKLIPRHKITALTLIPSVVHSLLNHPLTAKTDLSSINTLFNGAAHLPEDLRVRLKQLVEKSSSSVKAAQKKEVWFGDSYGLSEVTLVAIGRPLPGSLPPDSQTGEARNPPPTAGVLLPGMSGKVIIDESDPPREANDGESGELWLQGECVTLGYWNNSKATAETFITDPATGERWLRTGDRFYVTKEGWFFFADRGKDTLKVSGTQVSPSEIEATLMSQPDKLIIDVCVGGVSGGRTNDEKIPRAWIVLSPAGKKLGKKQTIEVLDKFHKENLSKYKWLRGGFEVVNEIPKNPTGKVLRRVLVDKYNKAVAKREAKGVKAKL